MAHTVKRVELEPLPKATVVYSPENQTLYIEKRTGARRRRRNGGWHPSLLRQG